MVQSPPPGTRDRCGGDAAARALRDLCTTARIACGLLTGRGSDRVEWQLHRVRTMLALFSCSGCARGTTAVEHVLIVALIALSALAAWGALGDRVDVAVECAAAAVAGTGARCGIGGARAGARRGKGEGEGEGEGEGPASASPGVDGAMMALEAGIGALVDGAGDGTFTLGDLQRYAAAHPSSELALAYAVLRDHPTVLNALDVAGGAGDVDGNVSRADLRAFRATLAGANGRALFEVLGDTASGGSGRDGYVSREDAEAIVADRALLPDVRHAAAERIALFDACAAGESVAGCEEIRDRECGGFLGDVRCWIARHTPADEIGRVIVEGLSNTALTQALGTSLATVQSSPHLASESRIFQGGVVDGLATSSWDVTSGVAKLGWKVVSNPIDTAEIAAGAVTHPKRIVDTGAAIAAGTWTGLRLSVDTLSSGTSQERGEVVGRVGVDLILTLGSGGLAAVQRTGRVAELGTAAVRADRAVGGGVRRSLARKRPSRVRRIGRGVVLGDFDPVSVDNAIGQLVTSFTPGYAQIGDVRDLIATVGDIRRRAPLARTRTALNALAVSSGMSAAEIGRPRN